MLSLLPAALIAFVLASPALCGPTSTNDPFRAIRLLAQEDPELPVCCLTPLSPLDPVEEEVLLSFEQWKEKQRAEQRKSAADNRWSKTSTTSRPPKLRHGQHTPQPTVSSSETLAATVNQSDEQPEHPKEDLMPLPPAHFRVPLTDRFNYASLDCSARVHTSHRSAKSASSILSHKRDKYMLSPCNTGAEKQFVVVELCEDIRIDTVQLANYEFFSGVFRDFTVSVAKQYTMNDDDWIVAGNYTAKNVRGVQSFHPPTSVRDFYKFIRIDFKSHYGSEFYCPVSLFRVYGLTHLEEWKWEVWEEESRAKRDELHARVEALPQPVAAEEHVSNVTPSSDLPAHEVTVDSAKSIHSASMTGTTSEVNNGQSVSFGPWPWDSSNPMTSVALIQTLSSVPSISDTAPVDGRSSAHASHAVVIDTAPVLEQRNNPSTSVPVASPDTTDSTAMASPSPSVEPIQVEPNPSTSPTIERVEKAPLPTGGESIYRTIMNRVTSLETNHTLYSRYIEEQMFGVREVLNRVAEDIGRLEGVSKVNAKDYQRTVRDWERQTQMLEMSYRELNARVERLSSEMVLEKALGIAQLCLLLITLIFVALTRGYQGESFVEHGTVALKKWRKRHLSFSGSDWVSRLTRPNSRSQSPESADDSGDIIKNEDRDAKVAFPTTTKASKGLKVALSPFSIVRERSRSGSRPRTPTLRTVTKRPQTPTRPALLKRANSGGVAVSMVSSASLPGGLGGMPRSAKIWARSAHLHQVKLEDDNKGTPLSLSAFEPPSQEKPAADEENKENAVPSACQKGKDRLVSGASAALSASPTSCISPGTDRDDESNGDVWVDTDSASSDGDSSDERQAG